MLSNGWSRDYEDRMAASAEPEESEICSICFDDLQEARVLPCIHSFCLQCLDSYCKSNNKLPGDDVPCPECRTEFAIPKAGAAGLTVMKRDTAVSIDEDIRQVTLRIKSFISFASGVEAEKSKLRDSVEAKKQEIKSKGEDVKQSFTCLIDRQVNGLIHKLQSAAEAELQSPIDAVQLALKELESFRTSSLQLKSSKRSSSDITTAARDLRARAKELLKKHVIPDEYRAPSYTFSPVNTDELLRDDQNFIGHVTKIEDPGMYCHLLLLFNMF